MFINVIMISQGLLILYIVLIFFIFLSIAGVVKAIREKEKNYFIVAGIPLLMALMILTVWLEFYTYFIIFFLSFVILFIILIFLMPKMFKIKTKEYSRLLEKTDLNEPIRITDFFSMKSWLKIASKYGNKKAFVYFFIFGISLFTIAFLIAQFWLDSSIKTWITYGLILSLTQASLFYNSIKGLKIKKH